MARSTLPTPEESLAGASTQGRTPMGKEGIKFTNASATGTGRNKLVSRSNGKSGDPVGTKANRGSELQTPEKERKGAAYTIKGTIHKPTDPAAGATQANGRIISSATNRDRGNFDGGMGASY